MGVLAKRTEGLERRALLEGYKRNQGVAKNQPRVTLQVARKRTALKGKAKVTRGVKEKLAKPIFLQVST